MNFRRSAVTLLRRSLGRRLFETVKARVWARRVRKRINGEPELDLIDLVVGPGDQCVDVGAYAGMYSTAMAHSVTSQGTVHSFEPFPDYARLLTRVISILNLDNVKLYPFALSEREGLTRILGVGSGGESLFGETHILPPGDIQDRSVEITTDSLDRIAEVNDFLTTTRVIKIDVEGSELSVLKGSTNLLRQSRPLIICEIEERHCQRYGHSRQDVLDFMDEQDFDVFVWDPIEHVLRPWGPSHAQNNFVFVNRESRLDTAIMSTT
jgi:FkbM family methyltransferase